MFCFLLGRIFSLGRCGFFFDIFPPKNKPMFFSRFPKSPGTASPSTGGGQKNPVILSTLGKLVWKTKMSPEKIVVGRRSDHLLKPPFRGLSFVFGGVLNWNSMNFWWNTFFESFFWSERRQHLMWSSKHQWLHLWRRLPGSIFKQSFFDELWL